MLHVSSRQTFAFSRFFCSPKSWQDKRKKTGETAADREGDRPDNQTVRQKSNSQTSMDV